jgi:hypothetical protein
MVIRGVLALLAVMLMGGCSGGIYDLLTRTKDDPYREKPLVESFRESNAIDIFWHEDEGADEYILERALDGTQISYEEVYRGAGLGHHERGLPDQAMYLYRLGKRRGGKEFDFSDPALGISSTVTRDVYEDNNIRERAARLDETPLVSNMQYYRSYSGFIFQDEDWYYTDIAPGWQAVVVINDTQAPPGREDSHFRLYIENRDSMVVTSDQEIEIPNYGTTEMRCYLRVYPYEHQYINDMPATEIGGSSVQYIIKIIMKQAL